MREIGFMQGRLSNLVDEKIQAFPWLSWQEEFLLAEQNGFRFMEWTFDYEKLYENPLMSSIGQLKINALSRHHGLTIPSLTGDCFMQAPFWKAKGSKKKELQQDFQKIVIACSQVGIKIIVLPLVDNGKIEDIEQENMLIDFLEKQVGLLSNCGIRIAFESDFSPHELGRFIARLDPLLFGVNYDIGNSASMGFDPLEEISVFGHRIINVHVKDRVLGGSTVALGTGNADFEVTFSALTRAGYLGPYILQTARAADGDHVGALCRYRDMTIHWLNRNAT